MVQSRSNKTARLTASWSARLVSGHGLMGMLAVIFLLLILFSREPAVVNSSLVLLVLLAAAVILRYAIRGAEGERKQTAVTVTDSSARLTNIDPTKVPADFQNILVFMMILMRRPLPAPSGIVNGRATDPNSIVEISPEEAERLRLEDTGPPPVAD